MTMTNLARYEFVSLVDDNGNPRTDFTDQKPPERVWTDAEMNRIREQAETAGYAKATEEAFQSNEARIAANLEILIAQTGGLREQMAKIEEQIVADAVMLARGLAGKIAADALHNDPLSVVGPVIETALKQMTGPHMLHITVHEILKPAITSRVSGIAEQIGFEGGIRVSGGADHMADCRIEWVTGSIERNHDGLLEHIDSCLAAHGYTVQPADHRGGASERSNMEFDFDDAGSERRLQTQEGSLEDGRQ